jgi:hypothetical protein
MAEHDSDFVESERNEINDLVERRCWISEFDANDEDHWRLEVGDYENAKRKWLARERQRGRLP